MGKHYKPLLTGSRRFPSGQEKRAAMSSFLRANRDKENCFRFAEFGASASDVVILGSPQLRKRFALESLPSVVLVPPHRSGGKYKPRFRFQILRSSNSDELRKHRKASLVAYLNCAALSVFFILFGERCLRDSIECSDSV